MAGEYTPLVSGRFRNLLCGTFSEGNKTWMQSELLGSVRRLQILGPEGSSFATRTASRPHAALSAISVHGCHRAGRCCQLHRARPCLHRQHDRQCRLARLWFRGYTRSFRAAFPGEPCCVFPWRDNWRPDSGSAGANLESQVDDGSVWDGGNPAAGSNIGFDELSAIICRFNPSIYTYRPDSACNGCQKCYCAEDWSAGFDDDGLDTDHYRPRC